MSTPASLLWDHRTDLRQATRALCALLDVHAHVRHGTDMRDASELIAGLVQMDDALRDTVTACISDRFDRLSEMAREARDTNQPRDYGFDAAVNTLLDTAGLIGLQGWLDANELTVLFEALSRIVGSRADAAERFLQKLIWCYTECEDRDRAGAALRALAADAEVTRGMEANQVAAYFLMVAGTMLGVSLPSVRSTFNSEQAAEQHAPEGSLYAERRRTALQRVAALIGSAPYGAQAQYTRMHRSVAHWTLLDTVRMWWRDPESDSALTLAWATATLDERRDTIDYLLGEDADITPEGRTRSPLALALVLLASDGRHPDDVLTQRIGRARWSEHRVLALELHDRLPPQFAELLSHVRRYDLTHLRQAVHASAQGWNLNLWSPFKGLEPPGEGPEAPELEAVWNDHAALERLVSSDPPPSRATLLRLAVHPYWRVRYLIASGCSDRDVLTAVVTYGPSVDDGVCGEVLLNPDAPSDVIELAYQRVRPGYATRAPVSEGPYAPYSKDLHAARNQATPPSVLAYVYTQLAFAPSETTGTRRALAANKATPPHVLAALATDDDHEVRAEVAMNASTRPEVVRALCRDPVEMVRTQAAMNPRVCAEWL